MVRLVILGGSGAGKSTQAQGLCEHFQIPLISTGDILREAIAQSENESGANQLGQIARLYINRGELLPDEVMIDFIRAYLQESDVSNGWILEGYPRTAFQCEELDFLLESLGQKLSWAIYLQVSEAVMVNRSLGRLAPLDAKGVTLPDDQPEIVQRRIELFYERTIPILEYYDRKRCLVTINGDQPPQFVQQNILEILKA